MKPTYCPPCAGIFLPMESLIDQYLPAVLPSLVSAVVGCVFAFGWVQSIKMMRRERGVRRLHNSTLRAYSFLLSGLITFATAKIFFEFTPESAGLLGVIVGSAYPIIMTIIMVWAKNNHPEMYSKLRIPRRRPEDSNGDHDDTGTFFW